MNKKIVLVTVLSLVVACSVMGGARAWQITPELQKEVDRKLETLKADPGSPEAHFELAITYAYTNKIQEGWDELKKVHDLDKNFAPYALNKYTVLVAESPNDWKLRFRLAFALYFSDKKAEAIDEMKRIVDMEPKDDPKKMWAYGYIGLIYGEIDQVTQGVKYIKKAIKMDSNVAALHLLLAGGYSKQGKSWDAFWEGVEALRLKALGY